MFRPSLLTVTLAVLTLGFIAGGFYLRAPVSEAPAATPALTPAQATVLATLTEAERTGRHAVIVVEHLTTSCADGSRIRAAQRLTDSLGTPATVLTRTTYPPNEIAEFKRLYDVRVPIRPLPARADARPEAGRVLVLNDGAVTHDSAYD
jgi:hypothetical protein